MCSISCWDSSVEGELWFSQEVFKPKLHTPDAESEWLVAYENDHCLWACLPWWCPQIMALFIRGPLVAWDRCSPLAASHEAVQKTMKWSIWHWRCRDHGLSRNKWNISARRRQRVAWSIWEKSVAEVTREWILWEASSLTLVARRNFMTLFLYVGRDCWLTSPSLGSAGRCSLASGNACALLLLYCKSGRVSQGLTRSWILAPSVKLGSIPTSLFPRRTYGQFCRSQICESMRSLGLDSTDQNMYSLGDLCLQVERRNRNCRVRSTMLLNWRAADIGTT